MFFQLLSPSPFNNTKKYIHTHTHSRTPVTIILRLSVIENNKLNEKKTHLRVNRVYSVEMRNILKMAWDARNAHFFANGFTFRFILHFNLCQQENKWMTPKMYVLFCSFTVANIFFFSLAQSSWTMFLNTHSYKIADKCKCCFSTSFTWAFFSLNSKERNKKLFQ